MVRLTEGGGGWDLQSIRETLAVAVTGGHLEGAGGCEGQKNVS